MKEIIRKSLKAFSICVVIAISEFLVLWLIAVLEIYYGSDLYYSIHTHPTVVGVTAIADIPLFMLVFYFALRQKEKGSPS